jgi:hypothetical protein
LAEQNGELAVWENDEGSTKEDEEEPRRNILWSIPLYAEGANVTLTMQGDGNAVVSDSSGGGVLFSSKSPGHPGAFLELQDDGSVKVILMSSDDSNQPPQHVLWDSHVHYFCDDYSISSSHVLHSAERQMQKETDGSKEESVWQTSIADLPQSHPISPLDTLSRRMFTVRLNTFRRNDQLLLSLNHHSKCPGVAKIQVIWSDPIEEPPIEVLNHPSGKVIVERHDVDSLNERFNMLDDSPTMGIFSLDDDLLWPCEALDSGM